MSSTGKVHALSACGLSLSLSACAACTDLVAGDAGPTSDASSGPSQPLRVHPANPRYFSDGSGKAIYLTGSHTWNNLQDVVAPIRGGFSGYLDFLSAHNHNFVRLWMVEHAWDADDASFSASPMPWPRSGLRNAPDGKPMFDLSRFDESYFERLRARASEASRRGIYVSVMLFDDWSTENAGAWQGHPFQRDNNSDGIDADLDGDGLGIEFHSLTNASVVELQEAYVRHVADTVADLNNVMFEISNETGVSKDWQYHMIDLIKRYEADKPHQHLVGITVGFPTLEVDDASLFASSADWISPNKDTVSDGSKVIILDSDHIDGQPISEAQVWKAFTHGEHPISMDSYEERPELEAARAAMGHARSYADKLDLAAMAPRADLADTGHCLAAPGSEYLVYQPASGAPFHLQLLAGSYRYEWFEPASGHVAGGGMLSASGGKQLFEPPFSGDAVLYLKHAP